MWKTPAELHAILNDAPAALLVFAVILDFVGEFTKKESIRTAGFWSLIGGTAGAILAVLSGLLAESWVEHGETAHALIEQHERFALITTSLFIILAIWRLYRRDKLPDVERKIYLGVAAGGLALIVWVGHLGGQVLFRYAGGIPTAVMEAAIRDRQTEHTHAPDEEHDNTPDAEQPNSTAGEGGVTGGEGEVHVHDDGSEHID